MALHTSQPDPAPESGAAATTVVIPFDYEFVPEYLREFRSILARKIRVLKEYNEAEEEEEEEEEEFGPILNFEEVMEVVKARGASIPLNMLKVAASTGIHKGLLLRCLDMQCQVSSLPLRHEIESSILLRNRSLVLRDKLDQSKVYNLSQKLLGGCTGLQFRLPPKMQANVLIDLLMNPYENLRVQAPTGSGRTACSLLAMSNRVDSKLNFPQVLYICHSREFIIQHIIALRNLGRYTGISSKCLIPGINKLPIAKLAQVTEDIILGTPPTVKKWTWAKKLDNSCLKIVILDDVDVLLAQDGFDDDLLRIMKYVEKSGAHCQVLLFSATFNETVESFVSKLSRITSFVFRLPKILVLP